MTTLERFEAKYMPEPNTGCWLWTAAKKGGGYGNFHVSSGKWIGAHIFAWQQAHGQVPPGLQLDHLCRVKGCVNPQHLEPVTQQVNTLRGSTVLQKKAFCKYGHPFEGDNLRQQRKRRVCIQCYRTAKRRWWHANSERIGESVNARRRQKRAEKTYGEPTICGVITI